jgi:hypothetical protein
MFVLMLAFLIGCGGKGGDTTDPTQAQRTILFTVSGSPLNNTVYLEEVSKNNDEITLAVKVKGGADVYGTRIEIMVDPNMIRYVSATKGSYFDQGGFPTTFVDGPERDKNGDPLNNGVYLIGYNRKENDPGVNGDGILCQIVFKALTAQTNTSISFNAVKSSLYNGSEISVGNNWIGGSFDF